MMSMYDWRVKAEGKLKDAENLEKRGRYEHARTFYLQAEEYFSRCGDMENSEMAGDKAEEMLER